jgi:hypothetical protein
MGCICSNNSNNEINEYEIVRVIDERTIDVRLRQNPSIQKRILLSGIQSYENEPYKRKLAIRALSDLFLQYRIVFLDNVNKSECIMKLATLNVNQNVNEWLISRGHAKSTIIYTKNDI